MHEVTLAAAKLRFGLFLMRQIFHLHHSLLLAKDKRESLVLLDLQKL